MLRSTRAGLMVAAAVVLGGCASSATWQGAEAEKAYDKDLEIKRLAEVLNNDDYFEFEKEGRIYVISDAKDYNTFLKTGELPYSTKKIGGGPGGKTIVYGLIKNETKLLEKDPKNQGAAQKMYEGTLKGMDKDFLGVVVKNETYYVFSSWKDLAAFKGSGTASGFTDSGAGPDGRPVVYVAASSKPEDLSSRFAKATSLK